MAKDRHLPIKIVFSNAQDFVADDPGGAPRKVFGEVNDEVRQSLGAKVDAAKRHFSSTFVTTQGLPAVVKITLKKEAVAKSHRPTDVFNSGTCPIIGGGKLGELYVGASPLGLNRLEHAILSGTTKGEIASISTVEDIQPYTQNDVLGALSIKELLEHARYKGDLRLRLRLFRHLTSSANQVIDAVFDKLVGAWGKDAAEELFYSDDLCVYCVRNVDKNRVIELASFPGTQSISPFPVYGVVQAASHGICELTPEHFPPPAQGKGYPTVGMIDSGTDPKNQLLQAWVVAREDEVPRSMQDNSHGSFVGGLLVHARRMNNGNQIFPNCSSRIVDIVAFDRSLQIDEYDLLPIIDKAIKKYPDVKVWNVSLSMTATPCSDHSFSEFGAALDERSRRHGIIFVIASGNFKVKPYRTWPPQDGLGDTDRICPPADAVRAVTIGSVAHLDTVNTRVRKDEPSPFSRRGPGPAYLIKPELVYFGGNCDATGACLQTGVISLDARRQLVEDSGTRYAVPLGSTVIANVDHELTDNKGIVTPTLLKAIVVHSAFLRSAPLDDALLNYCGIGVPHDIDSMLGCDPSSCTLILNVIVRPRFIFGKRPFPMPTCLLGTAGRKGLGLVRKKEGFRGEVFMTLCYDPPMAHDKGFEYCRSNVSASLGIVKKNKAGEPVYCREVDPAPKSLNSAYEDELVKSGYKWSPLKLYHRRFSRGPNTSQWRLTMEMLTRADSPLLEQAATLVITVRDPLRMANVYEEMVKEIDNLKWLTQDLVVRSRSRIRG
jgi:serine protease AprX